MMNSNRNPISALSAPQEKAVAWLETQLDPMIRLLETIVRIDSGSQYVQGINAVAETLRAFFAEHGIDVTLNEHEGYGSSLHARIAGKDPTKGHILLMGHMDTVYPIGTVAQRPWRKEGNRAFGPGVADMKAGLVMNSFVAAAIAQFGGNDAPVHVYFSCDEEIGSPCCKHEILTVARGALAVFNAEPGRISGNVVVERKGAYRIDFEVSGVAAHAGINPEQGASAIDALAKKIVALHLLNNNVEDVTLNVGKIAGGVASNVVAAEATAQLDVRYTASTDADALVSRIRSVIEANTLPRTSARITGINYSVPMKKTADWLFNLYQNCAAQVGYSVEGEATGGGADSGFTASLGVPTLCATGPVGGYPHSEREFCDLNTMVSRAQTLARAVLSL